MIELKCDYVLTWVKHLRKSVSTMHFGNWKRYWTNPKMHEVILKPRIYVNYRIKLSSSLFAVIALFLMRNEFSLLLWSSLLGYNNGVGEVKIEVLEAPFLPYPALSLKNQFTIFCKLRYWYSDFLEHFLTRSPWAPHYSLTIFAATRTASGVAGPSAYIHLQNKWIFAVSETCGDSQCRKYSTCNVSCTTNIDRILTFKSPFVP